MPAELYMAFMLTGMAVWAIVICGLIGWATWHLMQLFVERDNGD